MSNDYNILPIFQLYRLIKRYRIQVVHAHFIKPYIFARIAAFLAGTPVLIYNINGIFYDTKYASVVKKIAYVYGNNIAERIRPTDSVIAPSIDNKNYTIRTLPYTRGKCRVIYDGTDLEQFQKEKEYSHPFPELIGCTIIGALARLSYEKGIDIFIKSAARVIRTRGSKGAVKFVVVGDGPLRRDLVRLSRRLNVEDHVLFTGYREDVPEVLNAMDLVVIPSFREGMPLLLWEIMAMGKPVVASNVGGISEIVSNGNIGFLVEPGNIDALADSIIKIIGDKKTTSRMGKTARRLMEQKYSSLNMVRKVERLYDELLSQVQTP